MHDKQEGVRLHSPEGLCLQMPLTITRSHQRTIGTMQALQCGRVGQCKSHRSFACVRRFVAEWRRWLDGRGAGGPTKGEPGPLLEDRRALLDRYAQHTRHCGHCLKAGCRPLHAPIRPPWPAHAHAQPACADGVGAWVPVQTMHGRCCTAL